MDLLGLRTQTLLNIFVFSHRNPYLKTDSANLLIFFSVDDFNTRLCENFYVFFVRDVSSNNVCIALGKTQNAENPNPKDHH